MKEGEEGMAESTGKQQRDLVLAPNEYAYIQDETKGSVDIYCGPHNASLAGTVVPVVFDERTKRFKASHLDNAIQTSKIAPEGWYLVLKNPADGNNHPKEGVVSGLPDLKIGHKINIPGPASFSLWPGQMVKVVKGHHLRSNQYLIIRVYDEEAALENWDKTVMKTQIVPTVPEVSTTSDDKDVKSDKEKESAKKGKDKEKEKDSEDQVENIDEKDDSANDSDAVVKSLDDKPELTMGKLLVIKGTDVSFYIPPTGIEVVQDEHNRYVREAVTLERLEYCILLNEDGNKQYVKGPTVVFPKPTETFIREEASRKFKAIELNEISGLYIKVIADHTDESGTKHKTGDELFITGKQQMIYFPREEHAIIKYGEEEIHYAVAVPAGEARYVLDRISGKIELVKGPKMLLPDPRKEVIVRRVIDPKVVQLWFPGNMKALEYNESLMTLSPKAKTGDFITDRDYYRSRGDEEDVLMRGPVEESVRGIHGDEFERKTSFTKPRTITIDSKYDGAVAIDIWTGYAIQVVSKTKERHVVVGPKTCLLEYDELMEKMKLSTGTPKNDDNTIETVYLRVKNNVVSDKVTAETKDLYEIDIKLKYRVNFLNDKQDKWFGVENYIKLLTDHLRSLIRNVVKGHNMREFYADAINVLRDAILGKSKDSKRKGKEFEENGMHIYDVEILDVSIRDTIIANLLVQAQHSAAEKAIELTQKKQEMIDTKELESINRQIIDEKSKTELHEIDVEKTKIEERLKKALTQVQSLIDEEAEKLKLEEAREKKNDMSHSAGLERTKKDKDQLLHYAQEELKQKLEGIRAEVEAVVAKAGAIGPDMIKALEVFADENMIEKLAQSLSPLAILGGNSVIDVAKQLFGSMPLGDFLEERLKKSLTDVK
jgi:major vault protein